MAKKKSAKSASKAETTAAEKEKVKKEEKVTKAEYDKLKEDVGTLAADEYIENAKAAVKANDYDTAIEEYTKAWLLDKTNSDVLMNLAHCYRQSGDTGKADELYQQVIDTFPDTQNAMDAADYITEER